MTESSASPVLETELEISDKSPPKVLIQQPSESDNKSEENDAAVKNDQNGAVVNGLPENAPHKDASDVKSEETQDNVDGNQASAELESVQDNHEKIFDSEIVDKDDKKSATENNVEESDALNKPGDIETVSDNAENNKSTETIAGDATLELSRSKTPEIIITLTEDDTSQTNAALQENETAKSTGTTSPTADDSVSTHSDAKIQVSEPSQIEAVEDKTGSGSRPTSADRPKSKSPEVPPTENDTEKVSETSIEKSSEPNSIPIEKTAGILELVTNQTPQEEEPHPSVSEDAPETASNQEKPAKSPSPVPESKESQSEGQQNENPTHVTSLGDDVTSVTSDEHGGTENLHKDAYDASVSGNEEESNDQPTYTPTVIEKSMHKMSKQTELAAPVGTPTPADVPATSSETLVPSRPASSESRPRSPKSVKFSEDSNNVHGDDNASTDGAKKLEDLRHSLQTPLPVIIKQGDLELDSEEERGKVVEEEERGKVVEEEGEVVAEEEAGDSEEAEYVPVEETSSAKAETPEISPTPLPSTPDKERELKVKIQELNVQINELEKKISDLEEEKSRVIEEKNSQIKQMKSDYEMKIEKLQSEKKDLEKKINDKEDVIVAKDSENTTHKNEIQRLKNQSTKTKSSTCIIL